MADKNIQEGDEVAWSWGGGAPGGTAKKVKESEVTMETKKGNEVKKKGEPGNPAVYVERSGHDVVKKASELKVESKGPKHGGGDEKKEEGDAAATGTKRKAKGNPTVKQKVQKPPAKKQNQAPKKRQPKSAKTANGQPRRSGRIAAQSKN